MHEAGTDGALARELAPQGKANERVACRFCGSEQLQRLVREGYLQEWVYPLFGFYPWRCKGCASNMMLRRRYKPKRKARAE